MSVWLAAGACAPKHPPATAPPAPTTEFLQPAPPRSPSASNPAARAASVASLDYVLDGIFNDPILARALVDVRVESLTAAGDDASRLWYTRNSNKLVMPASNMKLHTLAAAAARLGWDFRYETRLETAGTVRDGVLTGDLVVTGSGDPSIVSLDFAPAPLFDEWADELRRAGITSVHGRLVGDDSAFADEPLGAGWAWDYLDAGYAAPSGALNYNENTVTVRAWPGSAPGATPRVEIAPDGHGLDVTNELITGAAGSQTRLTLSRQPGSSHLVVRGSIPADGAVVTRVTTIDRPALFFVNAFAAALAAHGIRVSDGATATSEGAIVTGDRGVIATHHSQSLASLAGYFMKVSQNFYAETLLKTLARESGGERSVANGRRIVRDVLTGWDIAADAFVIQDGSGLSRYDYTTADTVVAILRHVWNDETLRGPFVAALPVAGHDGTLDARMRGTILDDRVEAKTGSIANVRALSGYLETQSGERVVFSIIVNNFTAPAAQIDAVVERALAAIAAR